MKTVIVGLLLAFLLFTPQGQFIAMSAIGPAILAVFPPPRPDPAAAAAARWVAAQETETKKKAAASIDPRCTHYDPNERPVSFWDLTPGNCPGR